MRSRRRADAVGSDVSARNSTERSTVPGPRSDHRSIGPSGVHDGVATFGDNTSASPAPERRSMTRWAEIATIVGSVLMAAGVLVGGTRWAVVSAVEPLRAEVRELRRDVGALRDHVHTEVGALRDHVRTEVGALRGYVHTEVGALREDIRKEIGTLREDVHRDIGELRQSVHGIDVRLARVEEGQQVIVTRLERVESRLGGVESRLDGVESRLDEIEAQKVAARLGASRPQSGGPHAEDRRGVEPSRHGAAIGLTAAPPA